MPCLHLTLAQILMPGLQLPDDERIGQLVPRAHGLAIRERA
jgi:hypothetical protein